MVQSDLFEFYRQKFFLGEELPPGYYIWGSLFELRLRDLILKMLLLDGKRSVLLVTDLTTSEIHRDLLAISKHIPRIGIKHLDEKLKVDLEVINYETFLKDVMSTKNGVDFVVIDNIDMFIKARKKLSKDMGVRMEDINRELKDFSLLRDVPVFSLVKVKIVAMSDAIIGFRKKCGSNAEETADVLNLFTIPPGVLKNPVDSFTSLSYQITKYLSQDRSFDLSLIVIKNRFARIGEIKIITDKDFIRYEVR